MKKVILTALVTIVIVGAVLVGLYHYNVINVKLWKEDTKFMQLTKEDVVITKNDSGYLLYTLYDSYQIPEDKVNFINNGISVEYKGNTDIKGVFTEEHFVKLHISKEVLNSLDFTIE